MLQTVAEPRYSDPARHRAGGRAGHQEGRGRPLQYSPLTSTLSAEESHQTHAGQWLRVGGEGQQGPGGRLLRLRGLLGSLLRAEPCGGSLWRSVFSSSFLLRDGALVGLCLLHDKPSDIHRVQRKV